MRHYLTYFLLSSLLLVLHGAAFGEAYTRKTPGASGQSTSNPELNKLIGDVTDSVLSYFSPADGVIAETVEGDARVLMNQAKELKKGMRLSVFREGEPFHHPVTKEVIGRAETFIGKMEITGFQGEEQQGDRRMTSYNCRIISGGPQTGDVVRITSSKMTLAFFQDREADWSFSEMVYRALKDSGRFHFREGNYSSTDDPEAISKRAVELGAEAVLMFSTPSRDNNRFVNLRLMWPEDGKIFAEIEEKIEIDVIRESEVPSILLPLIPIEEEPGDQYTLSGGELIAMGDADGNGEREIIVSDGNGIKIYSLKEGLSEIWSIKGKTNEKHLFLCSLDLNNNGKDEIFVTALKGAPFGSSTAESQMKRGSGEAAVVSFVLEYDERGEYKRIWDEDSLALRCMGRTLLMQKFTSAKAFTGPVYRGRWSDGVYVKERPLDLPEGVEVYGFTYVDWQGNGQMHILAFTETGRLYLYEGSELIWTSRGSYGDFGTLPQQDYLPSQENRESAIRGRPIPFTTMRGQEVIVVKKIPFISKLNGLGYKRTEVHSLWWDGETMSETIITGDVGGEVTDYLLEGETLLLIAKPTLYTVLRKSLSGDFVKGSIVYRYTLSGK